MQTLAIGPQIENVIDIQTKEFDPRIEISADAKYIVRWLVILLFVVPVASGLVWYLLRVFTSLFEP